MNDQVKEFLNLCGQARQARASVADFEALARLYSDRYGVALAGLFLEVARGSMPKRATLSEQEVADVLDA